MKKYLPTSTSLSVNKSKGFTLVELLVVVAIIAVLAVIALAIFSGVQSGARDARRRSDIKAIADALEARYGDTACSATAAAPYCTVTAGLFANGVLPINPTPGGAAYSGYSTTGPQATFNACATLESGGTFCIANRR